MTSLKLPCLLLALLLQLGRAQIVVCSSAPGTEGPIYFVAQESIDPLSPPLNLASHLALLVVSADTGGWWDKSCGYAFHAACSPPFGITPVNLLGAIGHPVFDLGREGLFAGIFPAWASHEGDDLNSLFFKVNLLPQATLQEGPFASYADLFGHGEPWSTAEITTPYAVASEITARGDNAPLCSAVSAAQLLALLSNLPPPPAPPAPPPPAPPAPPVVEAPVDPVPLGPPAAASSSSSPADPAVSAQAALPPAPSAPPLPVEVIQTTSRTPPATFQPPLVRQSSGARGLTPALPAVLLALLCAFLAALQLTSSTA
jgi:hypothetical protein